MENKNVEFEGVSKVIRELLTNEDIDNLLKGEGCRKGKVHGYYWDFFLLRNGKICVDRNEY